MIYHNDRLFLCKIKFLCYCLNNCSLVFPESEMKILLSRRNTVIAIVKPKEIKIKWEGKVLECNECNCKFQLQSVDEPRILARFLENDGGHMGLNDFWEYIVFCPEGCGTMVKIGISFAFLTNDEERTLVLKRIPPHGG